MRVKKKLFLYKFVQLCNKKKTMKTAFQNDVVFRIRALREKNGYSQLRIAQLLGLSSGQIGNIETPKQPHKYTLAQLEVLCREFNMPIEQLFCSSQEEARKISIKDLVHKIIEYQQ